MLSYVYIRHADVMGQRAHLATLKKSVRKLKFSNAVFALSRINVLLARQTMMLEGVDERRKLQSFFVNNYIDDDLWRAIERWIGRLRSTESQPVEFAVFIRQQMLNLIRLCILVGREEGSIIVNGQTSGGYEFGKCCVMMNDHLLTSREERAVNEGSDTKRTKHISLQLAPILELYNPPGVQRAVVRAETLFDDILKSPEMRAIAKKKLQGFDMAQAFFDATAIALDRYRNRTRTSHTDNRKHFGETAIQSKPDCI